MQRCRFAFLSGKGAYKILKLRTDEGDAWEHKESTTIMETALFLSKHAEVKQNKFVCSVNMKSWVTVEFTYIWLKTVSKISLKLGRYQVVTLIFTSLLER